MLLGNNDIKDPEDWILFLFKAVSIINKDVCTVSKYGAISMKKLIFSRDAFKSGIRKRKPVSKILDLRKNHYNHIVCEDTSEVCSSYPEYLRSKHWKLFKKRYKQSDKFTGCCLICGKKRKLHHHHITYINLGKELLSDVVLLCGTTCHRNIHKALRKGITWKQIISNIDE